MKESIKIGIIQTSLNRDIAFKNGPNIEELEGERVWNEIKKAFSSFSNEIYKPDIVVIPELSVAREYIKNLEKITKAVNCITIAGVGYDIDKEGLKIKNQAIMIVPDNWDNNSRSRRVRTFYIGKSYFAPREEEKLKELDYTPIRNPNLYLFQTKEHGKFGLAICYDFLELQRLLLYQTEVQHFFILAYNRDINTFSNIAETVARTVFCNVIICNTGHYGGSLAMSPYYEPFRRTIFKATGNKLFSAQIVTVPLKSLFEHQKDIKKSGFKNLPPGYLDRIKKTQHIDNSN